MGEYGDSMFKHPPPPCWFHYWQLAYGFIMPFYNKSSSWIQERILWTHLIPSYMTRCSLSKEAYSQSSSPLSTIVCASRCCHQGRDTARRPLALIPYCLTTFHDFYSTVSRQSDCKSMGSQLMSWTQRVNHSTHLSIRWAYTLTQSDPPFHMQLSQLCTYVIKSAVLVAQSTVNAAQVHT